MRQPSSSGPFERPGELADALREQGAEPGELADLLPAVRRLSEWQAPHPSPVDTQRLLALLTPELPGLSTVRQAIRAHRRQHSGASISWLLSVARTQVSLFGLAFWLVSALVTLVGAVAVLSSSSNTSPDQNLAGQELLLRASGPFLAYLGTLIAFRGMERRVLECELVCLPSPAQLTLARLVIVLGYDICLGLALALALWAGGTAQVLSLTLSWLMPLLLVAGLGLLLSLRFSMPVAASLAYGSWLAVLTIDANSTLPAFPVTAPLFDLLLGGLGLALLAIALVRLQIDLPYLLPRM